MIKNLVNGQIQQVFQKTDSILESSCAVVNRFRQCQNYIFIVNITVFFSLLESVCVGSVSYTHLDVYKRQRVNSTYHLLDLYSNTITLYSK